MSGSAGAGRSVVVVPTPTDPAGIRRYARDLKTWSAEKNHTNVERGGSRDPGVRRPASLTMLFEHIHMSVVRKYCLPIIIVITRNLSGNRSQTPISSYKIYNPRVGVRFQHTPYVCILKSR